MILLVIIIEILILIFTGYCIYKWNDELRGIWGAIAGIFGILLIIIPILIGMYHGYINYNESNDKDLARITAVTQEQDLFKTYYKIEVEYLTNTPTQDGVVQNRNIEKDTFYCYYEDKELVEKMKANQYKELWIISGYKGGYETCKDFGTKLIKDIELKEE
jgi:hypothetical protein